MLQFPGGVIVDVECCGRWVRGLSLPETTVGETARARRTDRVRAVCLEGGRCHVLTASMSAESSSASVSAASAHCAASRVLLPASVPWDGRWNDVWLAYLDRAGYVVTFRDGVTYVDGQVMPILRFRDGVAYLDADGLPETVVGGLRGGKRASDYALLARLPRTLHHRVTPFQPRQPALPLRPARASFRLYYVRKHIWRFCSSHI
ncbi:hypothetical protein PR202_ga24826 [Eleusine coracana subsp. coracana]|uniref:Uncharacterized protein n=1 Tax=Eleusine coracana subsp. coracana TaxID=191504 RepID=A0AAV5D8Z7_ELECO|nr:hypothetical protein PR202_ga24826 [Eleusine coracana subsp. coracana]